jgi:hypothetical protein
MERRSVFFLHLPPSLSFSLSLSPSLSRSLGRRAGSIEQNLWRAERNDRILFSFDIIIYM